MSEPYSLAGRAWLPIATAAGSREFIRIRDIARPDILRIDTGRPDCDISVTEFLIGLLAISALAPRERRDWKERFFNPPSPEDIGEAIAPFAHALVLDGPGPRFFQDFEPLEGDETAVAALLMDQPGGKTQTDNARFFRQARRCEDAVTRRSGYCVANTANERTRGRGGPSHVPEGRRPGHHTRHSVRFGQSSILVANFVGERSFRTSPRSGGLANGDAVARPNADLE